MTTHTKLSPSARIRWGNCPGSVREESKYPRTPSGPAAIDGTHTHSLLEKALIQFNDAAHYVGLKLTDHEGEFMVDAERAERVQFCINYVEQRCVDLDTDKVYTEQRVNPGLLLGRDDLAGTVDITIVGARAIEIIDYKDGMNATDAKDQLEQYAVGVMAQMHANGTTMPDKWILTVVQPKLRLKGMKGVISREITLADLASIGETIRNQAAATDLPDAPLVPGEKQCRYCAHAGACSARATDALASAGITFSNLDAAKQSAEKEPTAMSDRQLREIIEAAPVLRQMIEGAEAEALRRMESGTVIDGLKAVRGRGSRGWSVSDETEMADKLKKFGLPKDVIWETKLISVAKAEKATWTKKSGGEEVKMQLSDRQLKTLKSEYTKTTEGKISVASSSDPRPAVTLSVAPMFTAVSTEVTLELPSFLL